MNTPPLLAADIKDPGDFSETLMIKAVNFSSRCVRSVVLGLVQLLGCAGLLLAVLCFVVWLSWTLLNCMSESWPEFLFCCFRAADGGWGVGGGGLYSRMNF